jgi:hypothetical protein
VQYEEPDMFDEHAELDELVEALEHVLVPRLEGIFGGISHPRVLIERGGEGILAGGLTGPTGRIGSLVSPAGPFGGHGGPVGHPAKPVGGTHGNPLGFGGLTGYGVL